MLKYPCLVLDHDDTVVQSEKTIGYPFFCKILQDFRPGAFITLQNYVLDCHNLGFAEMCKQRFHFTEQELLAEHNAWKEHILTNIPDSFPGIDRIIHRQKENGGLICVVSHSSYDNISRDYAVHFGLQPDAIYGWDYPQEQRKPNPYPLLDIMAKYQLSPKDLLVVDDLKLAWKMANPLNVPIAFAAWSKVDFPELATEMRQLCDFSFNSTEELEKFLFD